MVDSLVGLKRSSPVVLNVPDPIAGHELAGYCDVLGASEAQRTLTLALHERYLEDVARLLREDLPPIIQHAEELAKHLRVQDVSASTVLANAALQQTQLALRRQIRLADDRFFGSMSAILSPEQAALLPRAAMRRGRESTSSISRCVLAAMIDVSELASRVTLSEDDRLAIDAALFEYERKATPLMEDLEEDLFESSDAFFRIDAARVEIERQVDLPEVARVDRLKGFQRDVESAYKHRHSLLQQLIRLNNQTVNELARLLPRTPAQAVVDQYMHSAYPLAYPDLTDPIRCRDAAIEDPLLSPKVREAIEAIWMSYRLNYDAIGERIREALDGWALRQEEVRGVVGREEEAYEARMRKLRLERWQANLHMTNQIKSMIDGQTHPDLMRTVAFHEGVIRDVMTAGETDSFPPRDGFLPHR